MLLHDPRVAAGARDRRRVGLQGDERRRAAGRIQHAEAAQLLGNRDEIGRMPVHVERGDGREDVRVGRLVEVLGADLLDHDRDGVTRKQHGAEHRLLGIEIVRRYPRAARARNRRGRPCDSPAPRGVGNWLQNGHHDNDDPNALGFARAGSCGLPAETLAHPVHGAWTSLLCAFEVNRGVEITTITRAETNPIRVHA